VLLGEPPRSGGDLNFELFGIPVRVHPFFWLVAVMLGIRGTEEVSVLLIWVVAVFVSVLIHEMGHALTMRAYGIWPRVTLYGLGGLASYDSVGARRVGPLGHILISIAGPGSGFLLAAAIVGVLYAAGYELDLWHIGPVYFPQAAAGTTVVSWGLTKLLDDLIYVSIFWGAVNLLPVYPLDGGQIAREILVAVSPRNGIRHSLILSIVAAACMAIAGMLMKPPGVFMILMFGLLAYGSYVTLQAYHNQRGW
jgi:membrane-associated protease RseP (regulator of RpoE activity)